MIVEEGVEAQETTREARRSTYRWPDQPGVYAACAAASAQPSAAPIEAFTTDPSSSREDVLNEKVQFTTSPSPLTPSKPSSDAQLGDERSTNDPWDEAMLLQGLQVEAHSSPPAPGPNQPILAQVVEPRARLMIEQAGLGSHSCNGGDEGSPILSDCSSPGDNLPDSLCPPSPLVEMRADGSRRESASSISWRWITDGGSWKLCKILQTVTTVFPPPHVSIHMQRQQAARLQQQGEEL